MNRQIKAVLPRLALVLLLIILPSTTMVFARHHGGGEAAAIAVDGDYSTGLDAGRSATQSDNPNFDNNKSVSDCRNSDTSYAVAYCQDFIKEYYDTKNSLTGGNSVYCCMLSTLSEVAFAKDISCRKIGIKY